jgi:hypothetical protein
MSVAFDYLMGIGVTVGIATGWLVVQNFWRRSFPDSGSDGGATGDALAGRLGCHGCGECENDCERAGGQGRQPVEEDER